MYEDPLGRLERSAASNDDNLRWISSKLEELEQRQIEIGRLVRQQSDDAKNIIFSQNIVLAAVVVIPLISWIWSFLT